MLSLIAAASENNVIGRLNKIPWHMPRDLKHFAATTKGHTVIMGRNTYESILESLKKPLPERKNIVVTRQKDFIAPGCTVVHSLEEALEASPKNEEVFVIGGAQLYAEALPQTERIYRTRIHAVIEGDAFFPVINAAEWKIVNSKFEKKDEKNPFDATYEVYERA